MDTKKIFVLGNGFDLAHYLPTAYVHFMDAMMIVESSEGKHRAWDLIIYFINICQVNVQIEIRNFFKRLKSYTRQMI